MVPFTKTFQVFSMNIWSLNWMQNIKICDPLKLPINTNHIKKIQNSQKVSISTANVFLNWWKSCSIFPFTKIHCKSRFSIENLFYKGNFHYFLKLFFQISFLTSCLILYALFQFIKYSLYDTLKWESLCITITFNSVYFTYFQHYITYKHKRKWSCNALYKQWSTHMRMRMIKTMRM